MNVLIVDDSEEFARSAAELVAAVVGLEVGYTTDPEDAVQKVLHNSVSVVVLDQRMPVLSGTELFIKLHAVDTGLRAIMLTGEAGAPEVGQALRLGYQEYLDKGNVAQLPLRVQAQYLQWLIKSHEGEIARGEVVWPPRHLRWITRARVRVLSVTSLGLKPPAKSDWDTSVQLNAGQEQEFTYQVSKTRSISLELDSRKTLEKSLNTNLRISSVSAESLMKASTVLGVRRVGSASTSVTHTSKQVLKLPSPTEGEPTIRARHFQQAAEIKRYLVTLEARCRCCGISTLIPVTILEDTGRALTRHVDYLENGTVREVYTGTVASPPTGPRP